MRISDWSSDVCSSDLYKLKLNTTASSNSFLLMKPSYTITELESAINYWRTRTPSTGEEQSLCPQASALAETYALMIFNARPEIKWHAIKPASQPALSAWADQPGGHHDASRRTSPATRGHTTTQTRDEAG